MVLHERKAPYTLFPEEMSKIIKSETDENGVGWGVGVPKNRTFFSSANSSGSLEGRGNVGRHVGRVQNGCTGCRVI